MALFRRLATAGDSERQQLTDEITRRTATAIQEAAAGRVDPEIVALMARQPTGSDEDAIEAWDREVGARIGQVELRPGGSYPTADAIGPVAYSGTVRVAGGRLEIGYLSLDRVSTGLPLVLAWLTERGCADPTIQLTDVDAVGRS